MKEETELKFVILSSGAYSDYSPNYYVGRDEITQEELDKKGVEIGDLLLIEWQNVKEVPHVHVKDIFGETCDVTSKKWNRNCPDFDKVDENGKRTWKGKIDSKWTPLMEEWLTSKGFSIVPDDIPEINTYYDIPVSVNKGTLPAPSERG